MTSSIDVTGDIVMYAIWEEIPNGDDVEKEGENGSSIETSGQNLIDNIDGISDADKTKNIKVTLKVAGQTPSDAVKDKVKNSYSGYTLGGESFDIKLVYSIDGGSENTASLKNSIKVTIQIPDAIWSSDREYKLLHVHGDVSLINGETSNQKFTFTTRDFSEFAFIYRQRSQEENNKKDESERCHHDYVWTVIQKPTLTIDGMVCPKNVHTLSKYNSQL